MGKQNFSVTIPKNAQELASLGQRVNDKHVLDGATSVLNPLNMADFQTKTTLALDKDAEARSLDKAKEKAFEKRDLVLGVNNTNLGTVNFYVTSGRDVLLGFNKGTEHALGDWGYVVNTPKGEISVVIPVDAQGLIDLSVLIFKKHALDGATSVLNGLDMVDFAAQLLEANTQNVAGKQFNRDKEKANADRDRTLGIAKGQKTITPGTVKFYLTSSRDALLGFNKRKEHNLGDWGYDVQFSSAPGGPHGTFKAVPGAIVAGDPTTLEWNIAGSTAVTIDNGIGSVAATGSQVVTPAVTTVYKLTAVDGGGKTLTATVTVTVIV